VKRIFILVLLLFFTGCTYSVKERIIRQKIPASLSQWTGGIRTDLTLSEIKEAVIFGQGCKENSTVLSYAYIHKPTNQREWYIKVKTPMYLISEHALEQARQHRELDKKYLLYLKKFKYVSIDVTLQTMGANSLNFGDAYALGREVILLRNGKRVEPVNNFTWYDRINPFVKIPSQMKRLLEQAKENAAKTVADLSPEQKAEMEKKFPGSTAPKTMQQFMPGFNPMDNVFLVDDLRKDGVYEIIVRMPQYNNIFHPAGGEKRFSIDFKKFK